MTKTFLGKNIPDNALGMVYLCDYNAEDETIKVIKEIMFETGFGALDFYANTPNPESHVIIGPTRERFLKDVEQTNKLLKNKNYLKLLKESL